ncbi:hypothetical protein [Polaromonas eurypsychrophila]
MVAADRQIHKETPFPWLEGGLKTPPGTSGKAANGQLSWFHYAPEAGQTQSCGARKMKQVSRASRTRRRPPCQPGDLLLIRMNFLMFSVLLAIGKMRE